MGLKKPIKLNYRWRLFIPLVLTTWCIIAVIVIWAFKSEQEFNSEFIRSELSQVDSRILFAHEQEFELPVFINFLSKYYDNSIFDEIMISAYNERDSLIAHIGHPLPVDHSEYAGQSDSDIPDHIRETLDSITNGKGVFYYTMARSRDGNLTVSTAMPNTFSLAKAISGDSSLWIIAIILTILSTLVVFYSTKLLSRNVNMLRKFADNAAEGRTIADIDDLPHDELGDISRQIFKIYNQKLDAIEKSNREHRIAIHAIEEKALMRRQLTNNINHELKTPIGVIRGYIETILTNPGMDEDTRTHFLSRTLQNIERLCTMMNDISTMTRLEEGADNIPVSDINLHDLLYAVYNDIEASGIAKSMKIKFEVPLDCHVCGNNNLLTGMFMNLVKNAVIHSHGTEIGVSLLSESSKFYVFSFYDNGIGVQTEHLVHLFERFYRVDSGRSRKAGGTGLGLPIVKSTITSLGGTISVHNRSTGGLEFVFSLRKWI